MACSSIVPSTKRINQVSDDDETALCAAADNGHVEVVSELQERLAQEGL